MTRRALGSAVLAGTPLLGACTETPMGPTIPVMPGPNTSFSSFQNDQAMCRNFAEQAVRDQAQGANLRGLGTAALTTALGAGLGAAIGGGRGAGIGAAGGGLGGAGLAARNTSNANVSIQTQYNNAFASCMFSLGNSVVAYPVVPGCSKYGRLVRELESATGAAIDEAADGQAAIAHTTQNGFLFEPRWPGGFACPCATMSSRRP